MIDPSHSGRCSNCGAELAPQTKHCPNCRVPVVDQRPEPSVLQRLVAWRHFRHLLIVAILLLLPHVPHGCNYLRFKVLLRPSTLVSEAVNRANEHVEAAEILGRPITAGWLANGYVWGDETGWSEGQIWIRVFPDKPITRKPAEVRMGKGKGAVDHWVAVVRPGRILFEVANVPKDMAQSALRRAAAKLGLKTRFVERVEQV